MKKILIALTLLLLAGGVIIISCSRDSSSPAETEDQFAQAEIEAVTEAVLEKIDDMITSEIALLEKYNYNPSSAKSETPVLCSPVIKVETPENAKFPKTITLDWGSGCTDEANNFRAGKVIVHITGRYWEKYTVRHARLVDYRYNDLLIDGDRYEINKGPNEKGYIVFDVNHSEKIRNTKKEVIVERDLKRVRTCNRGTDLTTNQDDEVWIRGTAIVKNNGKVQTRVITTPLHRKLTCQHFQSGVITTFVDKVKVAEFNYGNGECDNLATWTNGTVTKEITLKTWVNHFSVKP